MAYTIITDEQIDPESPVTSELMTALRDNAGAQLGRDQTWQDVIGSRSKGTVYQNTTDKPIEVAVNSNFGSGTLGYFVSSDNITFLDLSNDQSGSAQMAFTVPVDYYYKIEVGVGTIYNWKELR